MSKRIPSLVLAGSLGLAGMVGGLVVAPAVASAATGDTTAAAAVSERVTRISDALAGLVGDGSITQEQADEVATTLAERFPGRGPGGHGGGRVSLDVAAETLGVTEDELRTALQGGQSLADVAAAEGVEKQVLVDALVAAANAHLDEEVAEGDLTQEQADARKAEVAERVAAAVEREGLPRRGGRGHGPDGTTAEPGTATS